jgi:DNA topoisomerase IA
MINTLPEPVTLPDMTAQWEQQLAEIEKGVLPLNTFMTGVAR